MSELWSIRKRPARLERRIEFDDYEEIREFLEKAADLSESEGYYPDMSFGRTHVSISLHPQDESEDVNDDMLRYAHLMDALVPAAGVSH